MNRSLSLLLAAAFALAAASAPAGLRAMAQEHAGHDEHAGHAKADAALQLNEGKRWSTDRPLRESMERIRAALQARGKAGATGTALALEIDAAITHMVRNCKLPPRADATLHVLIGRLGAASAALKASPDSQEPLGEVREVLALYPDYFEHPGWR